MNFECFTSLVQEYHYEEIKIIGRDALVSGRRIHLAAMVRNGEEAQLCILTQKEKQPKAANKGVRSDKEANREYLHLLSHSFSDDLMGVQKLWTDDLLLEFTSAGMGEPSVSDLGAFLLLAQLTAAGWKLPKDHPFAAEEWEGLLLLRLSFACPSMRLPDPGNGSMHLGWHMTTHRSLIEKPVVLKIGKSGAQKKEQAQIAFTFQNSEGAAQEAVCYIYQVSLEDPWEDQDRRLADPQYEKQMLEHMSGEEFAQMKRQIEEAMQERCPRGKYFPVLEYECTLPLQLQFASKQYLDARPGHSQTAISMMIQPPSLQQTGAHGLQLKNAVIQEPVSFETSEIEAELTEAYQLVPAREEELVWL